LLDLEAGSVKKKWKDKAFAAGTDRTEMEHAAQEFGIDIWEHTANIITAMRKIAPELRLVGNIQS
jgi:predicted hydrolase (HD superfamily)